MKKIYNFWKVIVLDILGVIFMIASLATGWLPGPGGIPLFLIGLSLLAINHSWAQKYIDLLKEYASKIGDLVFYKNPKLQIAYDLLTMLLIIASGILLIRNNAIWITSLGIICFFVSITLFLGNRDRYKKIKARFK